MYIIIPICGRGLGWSWVLQLWYFANIFYVVFACHTSALAHTFFQCVHYILWQFISEGWYLKNLILKVCYILLQHYHNNECMLPCVLSVFFIILSQGLPVLNKMCSSDDLSDMASLFSDLLLATLWDSLVWMFVMIFVQWTSYI